MGGCVKLQFKKSTLSLQAGDYLGFIFCSDSSDLQMNSSIQQDILAFIKNKNKTK